MVGFEVTPVTASSSSSLASLPWWTRSRERKSIQTLWPRAESRCRRESGMGFPFQVLDHLEPFHVPLPSPELGLEERADEIGGELGADHFRPEAEDVHVVVLDALVGRVHVVADRGADTRQLAGGDRGADAGTADQHSALGLPVEHRLPDLPRLDRVVDPNRVGVGAEVDDLMAEGRELLEHAFAELDTPMVERDRHPHVRVTLPRWTTYSSGASSDSSSASTPSAAPRPRSPATRPRACRRPT